MPFILSLEKDPGPFSASLCFLFRNLRRIIFEQRNREYSQGENSPEEEKPQVRKDHSFHGCEQSPVLPQASAQSDDQCRKCDDVDKTVHSSAFRWVIQIDGLAENEIQKLSTGGDVHGPHVLNQRDWQRNFVRKI